MRRRCRGRAGYVMIEALAALAVSALVLASVPLASGILIRAWQQATHGADTLDTLASGLSVIRRELSGMRRERFQGSEEPPYSFLGRPDAVGMVVADPVPGKGETLVMLAVRPEAAGNSLVRGSTPFRPNIQGFASVALQDPVVLLTGPWLYRFYYAAPARGGLRWLDEWQDQQRMPVAVRLDVLDYATGARVLPPMVVPLRVGADPDCASGGGGQC